jgi:1-acyl-sn-glycerol-3-phosphate acyltransferase
MSRFFPQDSYHTPADSPRAQLDRLWPTPPLYFYANYILTIAKARLLVARGRYDQSAWAHSAYEVLKLIERCSGRFHITGLDHIRTCTEPVVFISNHMAGVEASIWPCLVPAAMPIAFVVKASLLKYPLLGPVIASQQPIAIDRTNPREDFEVVMTQGSALLNQGVSLIIFPQSTRTTTFIPSDFNSLGVKVARRANVQVVPVAVKTDFWQNGRRLRDFGPLDRRQPIHLAFGRPLSAAKSRDTHRAVVEFISGRLAKWSAP